METIFKKPKEDFRTKLSMFYEKNRIETYKTWPFGVDKSCSANKMAEAGFVCTGTSQEPEAECFLCKKNLDGWEETDNPWEEHLKHSKDCRFAQVGKPEICLTIDEIIELKKLIINTKIEDDINKVCQIYSKEESVKVNNIKKLTVKRR